MKVEIKIENVKDMDGNDKKIIKCILFTKGDTHYLSGGGEGIFNCAFACPESGNESEIIKMIETSFTQMLTVFAKSMYI